jgi:hypothetical protein
MRAYFYVAFVLLQLLPVRDQLASILIIEIFEIIDLATRARCLIGVAMIK